MTTKMYLWTVKTMYGLEAWGDTYTVVAATIDYAMDQVTVSQRFQPQEIFISVERGVAID